MSYDLEQKIIDAPYDYNFFQAAHLIERYLVDSQNRSFRYAGNQNGALVFQTDNSIAFPGSDVVSIEKNSQTGAFTLNLSFMGLYGVSSPLPSYFTEPLNRGREEFEPLRKFLDIFSHRIYSLFYQTWKKYRYQIQINAQSIDDYSKALFSLTGLGFRSYHTPTSREYKQEMATVPLAKLMMGKVRSAANLQRMILHYFKFSQVTVQQFSPKKINNPAPCILGAQKAQLGASVLGSEIIDKTGSFHVAIGPLKQKNFKRFLKTNDGQESILKPKVKKLVDDFLDAPLEYTATVSLDHTDPECMESQTTLGGGALGWNTWLSTPQEDITLNI